MATRARQSVKSRRNERLLLSESAAADYTTIKRRHPACELQRPQTKICKWHFRFVRGLDGACAKQKQTERRIECFFFWKYNFRYFAEQRQCCTRFVIAEKFKKRFNKFCLRDRHEIAPLAFEIPNAYITQALERRAEFALRSLRGFRHAAHAT